MSKITTKTTKIVEAVETQFITACDLCKAQGRSTVYAWPLDEQASAYATLEQREYTYYGGNDWEEKSTKIDLCPFCFAKIKKILEELGAVFNVEEIN